MWGITASDSRKGYVAWGGPPRDPAIDGSVVPCAVAGSLMLAPDITLPAVREMRRRFGDRIYGRYGFADAFHPDRRLGQSRRHRHRRRHHAAQRREPAHRAASGSGSCATRRSRRRWSESACYHSRFSTERGLLPSSFIVSPLEYSEAHETAACAAAGRTARTRRCRLPPRNP